MFKCNYVCGNTSGSASSENAEKFSDLVYQPLDNKVVQYCIDWVENVTNDCYHRAMAELKATELVDVIEQNPGTYNSTKEMKLRDRFD
jgi:hypothetical protein